MSYVEAADVVHGRGAFHPEEIEAIAGAAKSGPAFKWLTGPQRQVLYLFAASSGFRAKEWAAVRKGDFGPELAFVRIPGTFTKNGKNAVQPIPSFLRPALTEHVAGLSDDDFLWPGGWTTPSSTLVFPATAGWSPK